MATMQTASFPAIRERIAAVVDRHPVVTSNAYTRWFATGEATQADVKHLAAQFSVFSHYFVEAQLRKVINAPTLEAYRAGKEILMNELGVIFTPPNERGEPASQSTFEPERSSTRGSVEGSRFFSQAAHFEWLVDFAKPLGLHFEELGKWQHATPATRFFCEELLHIYGAEDASVGAGASYAVEHWAAAGFWKELIAGLKAFKQRECPDLPLGFFVWHDRIEDQHAAHTEEELRQTVEDPGFNEDKFLYGATEMLNGVKAFWDGLDADRIYARAQGGD